MFESKGKSVQHYKKSLCYQKKHFKKIVLSVLCLLIAASFVFLYKYLNVDNPDLIVELNEEEISCELDDFFKSTDVYVCNDIENEILCKKYNIDLDESESIIISKRHKIVAFEPISFHAVYVTVVLDSRVSSTVYLYKYNRKYRNLHLMNTVTRFND